MDEAVRVELRQQLEKERDKIRATMEMPGQEKFADDLDNADQGTLAMQYSALENASIVRERLEDRLNAIEAALWRIDQGVYGRCEDCGNEIAIQRLRAQPSATLCESCAGE